MVTDLIGICSRPIGPLSEMAIRGKVGRPCARVAGHGPLPPLPPLILQYPGKIVTEKKKKKKKEDMKLLLVDVAAGFALAAASVGDWSFGKD